MKRALIFGITGQDGSYLAELLLSKNYLVHGVMRRSSSFNTGRIDHIFDKITLHFGDLSDSSVIFRLVFLGFDEIYNLGAQSHVKVSFDVPEYTGDIDALGTTRILEAIRQTSPTSRFYQASSSEMYGNSYPRFSPRSPYACAKVYSHYMTRNYRKAYNLFACNGILFNHESPRRGETFVTRKIAKAAVRISKGLQDKLLLGNLDATRDWGYAPEYMKAAWMMLQQDTPDDYVIATGETHTVMEFVQLAFEYLDLDWQKYVEIDPRLFRPIELDYLCGDYQKAKAILGWEPKIKFKELIRIMIDAEK